MKPALGLSLFLLAPCLAAAAETGSVAASPAVAEPVRNYVNLRAGFSTGTRNGRPDVCLEAAPLELASVEACGTGSGFLHRDPDPELAHFRAKLRLATWELGPVSFSGNVGLGFAELQLGEDAPGFEFTSVGPDGVETAGPELEASVRGLLPIAEGVELVGSVGAGAAWLPHAPELVRPQPELLPTIGFTIGVGY